MNENYKKLLVKQGYRFSGDHSVVKMCGWTKKALKGEGTCYKQKFYGIRSHRCVQMTPSANQCFMNCIFCWRDRNESPYTTIDDPEKIVEDSICAQHQILTGMKGNDKVTMEKYVEALDAKHFAISLTGEPTTYPKLSELIDTLNNKGISSFIVTNGMFPDTIRKMTKPTQLYVSVDAPNRELFEQIDLPDLKDAWERLMQTLDLLNEIKDETRTTIRITAIKGLNMGHEEQWAQLLTKANPKFVEVKGYVYVGASQSRLEIGNMPRHHEIKAFAEKIGKHCGYKFIDDQEASRVVLMMKEDTPDRIMKWEWEAQEAQPPTQEKKIAIPILQS